MRCQRISPSSNLKCNGKMRLDVEDLPRTTLVCFSCNNIVYKWADQYIKKPRRQWVSIRYSGNVDGLKGRIMYVKMTRREADHSTMRPSVSAKCPYLRCRWSLKEMQTQRSFEQYGYELICKNKHRIYLRMDKNPAAWV